MYTFTAERMIAVRPAALPVAIDELVAALWGQRAARIDQDQPAQSYVITGIDGDPDQTVWLSFRVTKVGSSSHVWATLDESTPGPDPTEALADLLDLLAISAATAACDVPPRLDLSRGLGGGEVDAGELGAPGGDVRGDRRRVRVGV